MDFDTAFTKLLGHEGAYSNNPKDPGGETMWGVTIAVARDNGYLGKMAEMPVAVAKAIYRKEYWDRVKADQLPAEVRFDVFDMAVNSGVGFACRTLQKAAGVVTDGIIGPGTLAAVAKENPLRLVCRMNGHRLELMTGLNTWPTFGKGWARRVASNLQSV